MKQFSHPHLLQTLASIELSFSILTNAANHTSQVDTHLTTEALDHGFIGAVSSRGQWNLSWVKDRCLLSLFMVVIVRNI